MNNEKELNYYCIFKEEKIEFQTLLEKIFLEYLQEKTN